MSFPTKTTTPTTTPSAPVQTIDWAAEIARLKAENEALKAKNAARSTISFKVSEKGALSIYGLGRYPVTLYKEQMVRLLDKAADIRAFITAHDHELSSK